MAKERKGQEGAAGGLPRWSPPAADGITPGDHLQYYSIDTSFTFRVLSLQHEGDWIFGTPDTDPELARGGPVAIPRRSCMTLETAARVLDRLPRAAPDGPVVPDEV